VTHAEISPYAATAFMTADLCAGGQVEGRRRCSISPARSITTRKENAPIPAISRRRRGARSPAQGAGRGRRRHDGRRSSSHTYLTTSATAPITADPRRVLRPKCPHTAGRDIALALPEFLIEIEAVAVV